MKFPISLLASVFDLEPRNEELSWQDFTELFAEPRQSPARYRPASGATAPTSVGHAGQRLPSAHVNEKALYLPLTSIA